MMIMMTITKLVEQEVEIEIDMTDILADCDLSEILEELNGLGYGPDIALWCKKMGLINSDSHLSTAKDTATELYSRIKEISSLLQDLRGDLIQI